MSLFHKNTLLGASGAAGGAAEALYVDDVFSIDLWTGNITARDINNDIDLSGEGGLVWIKSRTLSTVDHNLYDTERGATKDINTNSTDAEGVNAARLSAFNSDGYSLGTNSHVNGNAYDYCGWTFRKAPGFLDIVTYTGNGANRTIAHNLGSVPGSIWVKKLNSSSDSNWKVWHRSLPNTGTDFLTLNESGAYESNTNHWNSTAPTSTHFSLGTNAHLNNSGDTYVAYIFAHDDQSFGTNSDEAIIKCGSYTGNGSTNGPTVDLGFEPQYLLFKSATTARGWWVIDDLRGMPAGNKTHILRVNTTGVEATSQSYIDPTSTGFKPVTTSADFNTSGETYIYIAIRRPHKPPTTGTDVFALDALAGNAVLTTGFPVDLGFQFRRDASLKVVQPRLLGEGYLQASGGNAFALGGGTYWVDSSTEYVNAGILGAGSSVMKYAFKRAPGFMDVVAYTGQGGTRTYNHNLGVVPELIFFKWCSGSFSIIDWAVYSKTIGNAKRLTLNSDASETADTVSFNSTTPTSSVFSTGNSALTNYNGSLYVALLFATSPGVSKVGTYSGTGNAVDVNCGFSAGARWVMIKRTDATGDWYIFDSDRGIASGNEPFIYANGGSEQTGNDYIDPLTTGFTITSTAPAALNANGGTYIFLAIA